MNEYTTFIEPVGAVILASLRPTGWPTKTPAKDWPLVDFASAFAVASSYLIFVLVGRVVMPYFPVVPGLYGVKFLYNIVQIMLCSYMCIEAGVRAYLAGYTLLPCINFDYDNPPIGFVLYIFYLSKMLDFMDTFFIIAEKKWKQLSFLHVYHHFSVFLVYWLNVNIAYDGDAYLSICLNGFVHVIMYIYYLISIHSKDIWWKPALTTLQIVQFTIMNAQAVYLLSTGCTKFPRKMTIAYGYYVLSLLLLFLHFFIISYFTGSTNKKKGPKKKSQ